VQTGDRQSGPLSRDDVRAGLESGTYAATDLGWHEGLEEWQPLDRLLNHAAAPAPGSGPPPLPPTAPAAPPRRMEDDPGHRLLLPVGRSGWAIAAGYLGLFAFLIFPAPLALGAGLMALRDLKRPNPDGSRKYGMGRAVFGLVIGGIGTTILVFGLIAIWLEG